MNITVSFDQAINTLPTAFVTDVDAVVQRLEGLFRSNLSFTLHVGYGEVKGSQMSNALGESNDFLNSYSYTQIKNALASNASDVDQASSVASLPASDPISGSHTYWMAQTEAVAMGLPNSTAINGYVGFSSTANFDYNLNSAIGSSAYDFFGTVAHEITEDMGRILGVGENLMNNASTDYVLDLFHYSAAGVRDSSLGGYISPNGGATDIGDLNANPGGDPGDLASSAGDNSFLAYSKPGVYNNLTPADVEWMDILGYHPAAPLDFTGSGESDVLWRNANGDVAVWETSSAGSAYTSKDLGNPGTDWQVAGIGDFNNDGQSSVLWRNTANGDVSLWESTAGSVSFTSLDLGYVSTDWQIQQVGDFNNDGEDSVLWRNTNGDVTLWASNPGATVSFTSIDLGYVSSDWQIQQVGDFNGDGRDDILWRNTNGDVTLWNSNPSSLSFTSVNLGNVSTDWQIAGVGDFLDNGQQDILWRNSNSGDVALWELNSNATGYSSVDLGIVSTDWQIHQVGDYNGNGKAGILWQNTNTGDVTVWNPNSNSLTFTAKDLGTVSSNWHITQA